jgi:hypothetical protein
MREPEIRNPKPEVRKHTEAHRSADTLVGFRARMMGWFARVARSVLAIIGRTRMSALRFWEFDVAAPAPFRKYRVAPRMGTNTVRQRLLLGLHTHAALTATKTGMA